MISCLHANSLILDPSLLDIEPNIFNLLLSSAASNERAPISRLTAAEAVRIGSLCIARRVQRRWTSIWSIWERVRTMVSRPYTILGGK